MDETFAYLVKVLPTENLFRTRTEEGKNVVCPHGLEIKKFDACSNVCIIYHKEYEKIYKCSMCNTSRYKRATNQNEYKVTSGALAKVV